MAYINQTGTMRAMPLGTYIRRYFRTQAAFARHMGVPHQNVSLWVNNEWVVMRGRLYSPRRRVPNPGPYQGKPVLQK